MTTLSKAEVRVPMNDLRLQYECIKPEIDAALADTIAECSFILGPKVVAFEEAFAAYSGVNHCIGVSNGTDALKLALLAAGIQPGDEVITASFTFGATTEAICEVGARPVFVDIDPDTFTIDVSQVGDKIGPKTRALMPVHLYGQAADMDPLLELANRHGLVLIEDAAQAHGARYRSKPAGSLGDAGCFSFYPGKNLGAYGDAGGITTNDEALANRVRRLRNHGQMAGRKFWYSELGFNHRMDGLQGAVLSVKLGHLERWNERRREVAAQYCAGLGNVSQITLPREASYAHHIYHLFVIRVPDRQELVADLADQGIAADVHYPFPAHLTDAYANLGYREGDLPVSERSCAEILSLPIFSELAAEQVEHVIETVKQHYS